MYAFLIVVHVLISLGLIVTVLLQSGKGTGLAGAFGGGGGAMGAVFGGRGAATFLSKLTTGLAIAFFVSCLGHTLLLTRRFSPTEESVIRREAERQTRGQAETPVPLVPPPAPEPTEATEQGSSEPSVPAEGSAGQ